MESVDPPESAPPATPASEPATRTVPARKGSALRRQLATDRTQSSQRWQDWIRRRLSTALVVAVLGVGAFFGLRRPALRALAAGDGGLARWAVEQLVELRDAGSFGIYVHQLGLSDERETFAVLVYGLAGRASLPEHEHAPLAPPDDEAQSAHRALILTALTQDDPAWQRGAIYALLTLHERAWLVNDEALALSAKLLGHADPVVRRWAAMLLAWTRAPQQTHGALTRAALAGEPDARVRRYAIQALGRTRLTEHRPTLMHALGDDAGEVRREATLALSYLGGPVPLDDLQRMLRDSPPGQRPEVLTAIANDAGDRATHLLVESLRDPDAHVDTQLASARLLAKRTGPKPQQALIRALANPDPSVRVVAAKALVERPEGAQAIPALVDAFAARLAALEAPPPVAAWNELLVLHESLRELTDADVPTLTEAPASWEAALDAWRAVSPR